MADLNTILFVIIGILFIILIISGLIFFGFITLPGSAIIASNIIQKSGTNLCLSSNKTATSQYPLTIQTCGDPSFNQLFLYTNTNQFSTQLDNQTFCIDVRGSNPSPGTDIGIFQCSTSVPPAFNQQFLLRTDGTIEFIIQGNIGCLSDDNGNLKVATCNSNDPNQQWLVIR